VVATLPLIRLNQRQLLAVLRAVLADLGYSTAQREDPDDPGAAFDRAASSLAVHTDNPADGPHMRP
jgi:hypothetical protein